MSLSRKIMMTHIHCVNVLYSAVKCMNNFPDHLTITSTLPYGQEIDIAVCWKCEVQ